MGNGCLYAARRVFYDLHGAGRVNAHTHAVYEVCVCARFRRVYLSQKYSATTMMCVFSSKLLFFFENRLGAARVSGAHRVCSLHATRCLSRTKHANI